MAYFTDLYSPNTYETFSSSDQRVTGFRKKQLIKARRVHPGDRFLCYMTKLSRWVGILEVTDDCYVDEQTQIFSDKNDPFVVRFKVKPIVWLPKDQTIPIHEDNVWEGLSFTRGLPKNSLSWTGKVRGSITQISEEDGQFIERLLKEQAAKKTPYPVNDEEYRKFLSERIQSSEKPILVAIPEDNPLELPIEQDLDEIRESIKIQALLASIGEKMGFNIWIPKNDRSRVQQEANVNETRLLNTLPLNYDPATLRTIEQIDILWIRGRSIVRAFEVEHTTSVYSGILRMADLLALQPNMKIKLHIVAPIARKEKVLQEIQRPVFSLLESGPLSETCTYISYDSLRQLSGDRHLAHLSDSVLEEYEDEVD